jgi:ornithine cyclodeaminase/alanine dehydrogenase-like protein (mu-crystallin family)
MTGLRVLRASDVDQILRSTSPQELLSLMALVFTRLSAHSAHASSSAQPSTTSTTPSTSAISTSAPQLAMPHRLSVPTASHTALFMPARLAPFGTSIKVVAVPSPSSSLDIKAKGLPASTLVLDEMTGAPRALINASALTAVRTAAGRSPSLCESLQLQHASGLSFSVPSNFTWLCGTFIPPSV